LARARGVAAACTGWKIKLGYLGPLQQTYNDCAVADGTAQAPLQFVFGSNLQ